MAGEYLTHPPWGGRAPAANNRRPKTGAPMLGPLSDGLSEIYQFKVEGKGYSLMQLRSILDWQVAPRLKQVAGITEGNVHGGELKTYEGGVGESALTGLGLA